ncbi:septation ring formation regulator EzrA [bacterium LRH843]|nr:septation ring formation regulator EzrA [bacterium LRH843]
MPYLIYTIIAVIIILIIVSAIFRKRTYKEVDRLEEWKNNLINRPITDEIGKVKQLQMSGQTEEKFEEWRNEWDDIVGTVLPHIEEQLFDIEDLVVKNRFRKAKQLISVTDQRLNEIEKQLTQMLADIQQLVQSEEQNRTEIDYVREQHRELSGELLKKKGTLGEGLSAFEERYQKVDELLEGFDQATDEGSYLQARENLLQADALIQETAHLLERYPTLLVQIDSSIPNELNVLLEGIKEMEEAGYELGSFELYSRIDSLREELEKLKDELRMLQCDEVEQRLVWVLGQLDQLYDTLENEVESKQYVSDMLPELYEQLEQAKEQIHTLQVETNQVQQSYHISKEQLQAQGQMEEDAADLWAKLHVLEDASLGGKQTFTSIREMIAKWQEDMTKLFAAVESDQKVLYALREDEWKAQQTLHSLHDLLLETKRNVQKSNIPGLPERSLLQLEQAEKKLIEAFTQLEQVPLELGRVSVLVEEAVTAVKENAELIDDTIQLARQAELVIQFGNRYRSRSQAVQVGLLEAEQNFRLYDYEEAIECAVQAIQAYEPNVLERVEEYMRAN